MNHLLTCKDKEAEKHRNEQLLKLTKTLQDIKTPTIVLDSIIKGITHWVDSTETARAPSAGSVLPINILLTQAYNSQTDIGWGQFLRGRGSTYWCKAVQLYYSKKVSFDAASWSSKLVKALLSYTLEIWKYRNGVVHGHTREEMNAKQIETLQSEIAQAYQDYETDHFIISRNLSSLFKSTLEDLLERDIDILQSWIRTYREAVKVQLAHCQRYAQVAKTFFLPRRNLSVLQEDGSGRNMTSPPHSSTSSQSERSSFSEDTISTSSTNTCTNDSDLDTVSSISSRESHKNQDMDTL
jgi:hypothetical protein